MPQALQAPALVLLVGAVCVFAALHVSHVQIATGCEPLGRAERDDDDELLEEKELLEEDELLEDEELEDDELDDELLEEEELLEDKLEDDERLDELEEDKLLDELNEERLDDDDGIISLPHQEGRAQADVEPSAQEKCNRYSMLAPCTVKAIPKAGSRKRMDG